MAGSSQSCGSLMMHDSHRLFLQTFMSHGMLSTQEVHEYFQEACIRYGGNHSYFSQSLDIIRSLVCFILASSVFTTFLSIGHVSS